MNFKILQSKTSPSPRLAVRPWGAVPLAEFDIYDKALKRVERITDLRIASQRTIAGGVFIVLASEPHQIRVGLNVRKVDGELSIEMPMDTLVETDAEMFRLYAVNVLPGLLSLKGGTLLLPLNTGMICPLKGKPAVQERFLIYGEQDRWELTPVMPFCAGWDGKGRGLMALARQGACDAECRVETDGKGGGRAGFAFSLRRTWVDPVDSATRELRWMPIPAKADPVMFCALRLRRHIVQDLGKKTLRQRAAESPAVAYLTKAYIMKLFFGMKNVGALSKDGIKPGEFMLKMTFDEAASCLRKLKQAGIDTILTQCVGWNIGGHDGLYPTRFPIEERSGGETAFRHMIHEGNALGFNIQVHDNFIMQAKISTDFDPERCTIDVHGEPLIHGRWAAGTEVAGWPLAYPESYISGHLRRMKGLGLKGMYYVDYMEQPLEVNYHPVHKGPRSACARGQALIVEKCREAFGACGTEFGFLPIAVAADHIATCGNAWHLMMCKPEWPIMKLVDKDKVVPIWQIAMSGLVALEAQNGEKVTWENAMRCVLFGGTPRDEWSTRPGHMPVLDDARIAALKATYDLCVLRFGHLKFLQIVDYKRLAAKVYETAFEDGTRVRADFGKGRLFVNGKEIPKAKSFQ